MATSSPIPAGLVRVFRRISPFLRSSTTPLSTPQQQSKRWESHKKDCRAVNCITKSVSLKNVVFEADGPVENDDSIVFLHRFVYKGPKSGHVFPLLETNVFFSFAKNNDVIIAVSCSCLTPFSDSCFALNMPLFCKAVMLYNDGTYQLEAAGDSQDTSSSLEEQEEEEDENENVEQHQTALQTLQLAKDSYNRPFCQFCFKPEIMCSCVLLPMSKHEIKKICGFIPRCRYCKEEKMMCTCGLNLFYLIKFYRSLINHGRISKNLWDFKKIAYLKRCNASVCYNCSMLLSFCVCPSDKQVTYPSTWS
ncbi:E3 [Frog adenovirus 1]|uniref:E3 n=1 Tax=Frog adenovirus 1 (strain ATCC VR-896) TaxID=114102 RepID=Q9IIG8_ADEF1|nr:E3 [Frog adenovirus 1]AAF86939.1 E3 [Frog adenovirus 1]